jgi:hypothetical protein
LLAPNTRPKLAVIPDAIQFAASADFVDGFAAARFLMSMA